MSHYYILDEDGSVIPCTDVQIWAEMFEDSEGRIVKQDYFGKILVSTVFIGIDHILFETMVLNAEPFEYQTRCSTWDEALEEHEKAINALQLAVEGVV